MVKHDIIVVGASAGGVAALQDLLGGLPKGLAASVFVVLHIPPDTKSHLAEILGRSSALEVREARDHEQIAPSTVYVAQADRHLLVSEDTIRITRGPKECRARPAVDALFRSAAVVYGPRVIGVVMTGMLDDGTAGLWAIKDQGGIALVQDPATAEFPSMPESAMKHVQVDAALSIPELATRIAALVGERPTPRPGAVPNGMAIETLIALQGNGLKAGVMHLGAVSGFTCPSCHGVLVQIEEGNITRFRCHTGHAYSQMTLLAEINLAVDEGLWDTLRSLEEKLLVLKQMAAGERRAGNETMAATLEARAAKMQEAVGPLHDLVSDGRLFDPD